MPSPDRVSILVPGDDPVQIAGSAALDRLAPYGGVTLHTDRPDGHDEKLARAADAAVIINSRSAVTWRKAEFEKLPKLRMITTCSIGTDMIDLDAATEHGVVVSNQPGRTAPAVAEHMFGLMFAVAKRAAFQTAELKAGRWTRLLNIGLQGKTLGVVGTGAVGAEMARLANALGMRVIAWSYHPSPERGDALGVTYVPLDELLATADVVSLHVKLTDDSRHLIDAAALAAMKDEAILLNGARGDVVDMAALDAALGAGRFSGVGLDVYPQEPLAADAPILSHDHVVLTPHAADWTAEATELLNEGAVDNVIAFLEGRAQNVVTG
jgi:phosphoglycerate dehydrogenase-like enzyme